jgi:hypothetical protein
MPLADTIRIAMWSGPRNISTAMLRSWGNRPDTFVCDEPLYAHYLRQTGADHPAAAEIVAHYETDWRRVVQGLTGDPPEGAAIYFQKHMTHHLLPAIELDWLARLRNWFLIRDPREVLTSYIKIAPRPTLDDLGLPQQVRLFEWVRRHAGVVPPVLDAGDVLADPRGALTRLCAALGVPFLEAMLAWPPGRRATDGIWAPHWYGAVEKSTGFQPYQPKPDRVPDHLAGLLGECQALYQELYRHRLGA